MDPRAVWKPVGPLPARIYWARRAVPLLMLVVIVVLIAYSCAGGGGAGRADSTGSPHDTPRTTTSATEPPCATDQLVVTASTDAGSYPAGVEPRFAVSIRSQSASGCTIDDSAQRRVWTVYSGADRVWTSAACPATAAARRATLGPDTVVRHSVFWDRRRSTGSCTSPGALAAPGTYRLYVTVELGADSTKGGVRSAAAVFHLTR